MASALRNRVAGKFRVRSAATVAGSRRAGAGKRVSTENDSNAAWPDRPKTFPDRASAVGLCWSWSATDSATATLASTRTWRPLPLVGIAERPDQFVVDGGSCRRYYEPAVALLERVGGNRFDAQAPAIRRHLHLAGTEAHLFPQALRNYQPTCRINGSSHTIMIPVPVPIPQRGEAAFKRLVTPEDLYYERGDVGATSSATVRPAPREAPDAHERSARNRRPGSRPGARARRLLPRSMRR